MALAQITDLTSRIAARVLSQYKPLPKFMALLGGITDAAQEAETAVWGIVSQFQVSTSQGAWLDLLGKFVDQVRGGSVDGFFRALIAGRIIANGSNGSMNDVLTAVMKVVGPPPGSGEVLKEWDFNAFTIFLPDSLTQFSSTPDQSFLRPLLSILRGAKSAGVKATLLYQADDQSLCFVWDDASNPGHVTGLGWGDAANPLTQAGEWAGADDA